MAKEALKPYLTIPLLEVCNFKCVYCPPEGETYHTPKAVFSPKKVGQVLETAKSVGMSKVRFSGGEPLLYPHLETVIQHAVDLGLDVHMNTNGLLLLKHLPWLKKFQGITVKVSLDAYTNNAMKAVAKVANIEKVVEGIRQGAEAGIVKRLNFVLTRLNINQVSGVLALCRELGLGLKIFDMYPVPETEQAWHTFFAPIGVLGLKGISAPIDPYTQKYGTPTTELIVEGVHVRIKNCYNGTRYHSMCQNCPAFPCPEGLYCLQVTPSLTVVPCRLGTHLYQMCHNPNDLKRVLSEIMAVYEDSYHANLFGQKYQSFHNDRLIELQGGKRVPVETVPALGELLPSPNGESIRC